MTASSSTSPHRSPDSSPVPDPLSALPPRIVFYDGVCGFCDASIRWLRARDRDARLCFAPLQGATAAIVRRAFAGFPTDIDTIVYFRPKLRPDSSFRPKRPGFFRPRLRPGEPADREILLRSAAIFALIAEMGGPWRLVGWLRWLPRPLTDFAYRTFAKNRYRWFGVIDACDIPTPEERLRLLP